LIRAPTAAYRRGGRSPSLRARSRRPTGSRRREARRSRATGARGERVGERLEKRRHDGAKRPDRLGRRQRTRSPSTPRPTGASRDARPPRVIRAQPLRPVALTTSLRFDVERSSGRPVAQNPASSSRSHRDSPCARAAAPAITASHGERLSAGEEPRRQSVRSAAPAPYRCGAVGTRGRPRTRTRRARPRAPRSRSRVRSSIGSPAARGQEQDHELVMTGQVIAAPARGTERPMTFISGR
jgi:hypothetical protein